MRIFFVFLVLFFLVSAAQLPYPVSRCIKERVAVIERYYGNIDMNLRQFVAFEDFEGVFKANKCGLSGVHYIVSTEAMNAYNQRYGALVDYVKCLERNMR